jgi:hypothetical protein
MTDAFLCKPIGRAMTNPLTLAFMLTIIIMIIVTLSYDAEHKFRTAFRIFSISTMFLFMNNHILMQDMNCRKLNADQDNILRIVENGSDVTSGESLVVPVAQNINDSGDNVSDTDGLDGL